LLNNRILHSSEKPLNTYWIDLIMETERAIKLLDAKMPNPFWILAAKKLKQIFTSDSHHNTTQKQLAHILKNINHRLLMENAIIIKTDKGKTSVIIYSDDYAKKIYTFLSDNKFRMFKKIPLINTNR